jgi:hypothetical protein
VASSAAEKAGKAGEGAGEKEKIIMVVLCGAGHYTSPDL